MKIKTDFVTNSSSSSYMLLLDVDTVEKLYTYMEHLQNKNPHGENYLIDTLETEKQLREYTDGEPLDWVNKTRPPTYLFIGESDYNQYLAAINEGKVVVCIDIDYENDETFKLSEWGEYIA